MISCVVVYVILSRCMLFHKHLFQTENDVSQRLNFILKEILIYEM